MPTTWQLLSFRYISLLRFILSLDFEIRGHQQRTIHMCTGHPVFHYSAFAMGFEFLR